MKQILDHFERYFGAADMVLHELKSELVHLDVHVVFPSSVRPWWTLFTTGMSDLPMTVPECTGCAEAFGFAELVLCLPRQWRVDVVLKKPWPPDVEQWYWPIRSLRELARFPHERSTWLGFGHTIQTGHPPEPLGPGTQLCSWLLLPPASVPEAAQVIPLSDGRVVNLYCIHALHLEELRMKQCSGLPALLDAFEQEKVSEVLDPRRKLCVRRTRARAAARYGRH